MKLLIIFYNAPALHTQIRPKMGPDTEKQAALGE